MDETKDTEEVVEVVDDFDDLMDRWGDYLFAEGERMKNETQL